MSWDVIIQSTKDIPSVDDMESNSIKSYLGPKKEVVKTIVSVFDDVDFSDKNWGFWTGKIFQ
jgi:hypothetical protein